MRPTGKRPTSKYRETGGKTIAGTRFHELFFSPLPSDANPAKVKSILKPTGVQCKDIRIHKGPKGCSAFVVFHCDSDAAAALKAFRSDPLFIDNKRIEIRYTMDYTSETTSRNQKLTARIKESFNWMAEHNISVRDLPKELEEVVGTTNFTDITNTNFSSKNRYTECAFFSTGTRSNADELSSNQEPVKAPDPVIYKSSQILQLYKKAHEPVSDAPKTSKSSRKKAAKKRSTLSKIEAEITRKATVIPLQPGMGRGFCQQRSGRAATVNKHDTNLIMPSVGKPFAVICPTKRVTEVDENVNIGPMEKRNDDILNTSSESGKDSDWFSGSNKEGNALPSPGKVVGRGRGIATLSADMLRELSKF